MNTNWALILGGSSGLGLASAQKLAAEGFNLLVLYRDRKSAAATAEAAFSAIRQLGVQCRSYNRDALKPEVQQQIIDELQQEDIQLSLVLHSIAKGNLKQMAPYREQTERNSFNEAALQHLEEEFAGDKHFLKEDDLAITLQAMASSHYSWCRLLFENNCLAKGCSILAFTSEGSRKAWRNYGAVGAAKAALEAISRSMAVEFAPHGIRSNIIQAGVTETAALAHIKGNELIKQIT